MSCRSETHKQATSYKILKCVCLFLLILCFSLCKQNNCTDLATTWAQQLDSERCEAIIDHKLSGIITCIRCSSVAWSWLLERILTSSCRGGLGTVEGVWELSWPTADNPLLGCVWVNILGERSRFGAIVAGILWGEITCTDREHCTVAAITSPI